MGKLTGDGSIDIGRHSVAAAASPSAQLRSVAPTPLACRCKTGSLTKPTAVPRKFASNGAAPDQSNRRKIHSRYADPVFDAGTTSRVRIAGHRTLYFCALARCSWCAGQHCSLEHSPYLRAKSTVLSSHAQRRTSNGACLVVVRIGPWCFGNHRLVQIPTHE